MANISYIQRPGQSSADEIVPHKVTNTSGQKAGLPATITTPTSGLELQTTCYRHSIYLTMSGGSGSSAYGDWLHLDIFNSITTPFTAATLGQYLYKNMRGSSTDRAVPIMGERREGSTRYFICGAYMTAADTMNCIAAYLTSNNTSTVNKTIVLKSGTSSSSGTHYINTVYDTVVSFYTNS